MHFNFENSRKVLTKKDTSQILTTMVVNIVQEMIHLGFSEYESRAYVSLLEEYPLTAYEVAKRSGIPTSKIYEVMARLVEKNLAEEISDGKKRYIPIEVSDFVQEYRKNVSISLEKIKQEGSSISRPADVSYIIQITSYKKLIRKAESLISGAAREVLISGWDAELSQLLHTIQQSSVRSAVVHFGKTDKNYGMCFEHPVEEVLLSEKGGRQLVIAADSDKALSATVHDDFSVEGAWSTNSGFARLAEDCIKHDIYIIKAVSWMERGMKDKFGDQYQLLRDIFNNEVIEK